MAQALLLDINGVLHQDGKPLPGALEAVRDLQARDLPLRFVTNTSRKTAAAIHRELRAMGFAVDREQIHTAPLAIRRYLERHDLRPFLLIHEDLEPEFDGLETRSPNAVVLCDAEERLNYGNLDAAFQLLLDGVPLLAVGTNRYFSESGRLHLDAGPFIRALEYAADSQAVILGKPAKDFFVTVLDDLGVAPGNALMVGDDAEADVAAAIEAGLEGCLVRTGKYRQGDEERAGNARVENDLAALVGTL